MQRFKVGDAVVLAESLPEEGLSAGQVGAVVLEFTEPTLAYETEFTDGQGRTLAQVALLPEQIEPYAPALNWSHKVDAEPAD